MPSAILLAHIEMWVTELDREVQAFEEVVKEVEVEMEKAEQDERDNRDNQGLAPENNGTREASVFGEKPFEGNRVGRLPRLERVLAKAKQIEGLVNAANTTLNDALEAARLVVANERIGDSTEPDPSALPSQAIPPAQPAQPAQLEQPAQSPVIKVTLANSLPAGEQADLEPLARGSLILNDRYRIVEVLQRRPRINLYLAHRLNTTKEQEQGAPVLPLVAIRELVLSGLPPDIQKRVEKAAFQEFVAPGMFGSPRLPGVGDRMSIECDRHYLVMQLRPVRNQHSTGGQVTAVPLAELLLKSQQWPSWLGAETALEWGTQLCRIVARLHRIGVILGWLDPATILVDSGGPSAWAPVLLVCWPPAMRFWADEASYATSQQIFPLAAGERENPFAAPETLYGQADERSDIYSLGALLYLFFTRYAPIAAALRQSGEQPLAEQHEHHFSKSAFASEDSEGMVLVPPHLFSNAISPELEAILLRALSLHPDERYANVFALVEALEAIDPARLTSPYQEHRRIRQDSKVTKALWGLRRHS